MKKNKFDLFTKDDYNFIPANVVIVRNKYGWLWLLSEKAQWHLNHTNDNKDCAEKDIPKFLKTLVKAIKQNMLMTPNPEKPTGGQMSS